jgi:hypothetical protein
MIRSVLILFLCLISISITSCSYGLAKPKAIDLDCEDDFISPTIPAEPKLPVIPEDLTPPTPTLTHTLEYTGALPFIITAKSQDLWLEATVDGVRYTKSDLLPTGWTVTGKSTIISGNATLRFSHPEPLRFIPIGVTAHKGYFTFELVFEGMPMYSMILPFGAP